MVTTGRPGRASLVAVAAVVVVVAVVTAGLGLHAWYERQPPALDDSGPGTVLRLTTESGGVPPPRVPIRLQNGLSASVSMAGLATDQGRPAGLVMVQSATGQRGEVRLAEGESIAACDLRVTMVHVWRMPDSANDALDVRVLPAPGSNCSEVAVARSVP
jgi:hypothetical protein